MVMCRGQGQEPRLEFNRNLVEFGPVLPHSIGDEQDIIVKNPCEFPIEFYSLESDRQYLEEEKILRLMKGWDEYNTILLPPRVVNDKLPEELINFYEGRSVLQSLFSWCGVCCVWFVADCTAVLLDYSIGYTCVPLFALSQTYM